MANDFQHIERDMGFYGKKKYILKLIRSIILTYIKFGFNNALVYVDINIECIHLTLCIKYY